MHFDSNRQPSSHAVSKPIDILQSAVNCESRELERRCGYRACPKSSERARPVNRVKPVIINAPTMNSISSSNSSLLSPIIQPPQRTSTPLSMQTDETANKENCNRMQMIYNNIYATPSSSNTLRSMPAAAALTKSLFNYVSPSPSCSYTDYYFSDEEERVADGSDYFMPTEFRSIGDIIGYANVIRSQRTETIDRFNTTMTQISNMLPTLRRDVQARTVMTTPASKSKLQ